MQLVVRRRRPSRRAGPRAPRRGRGGGRRARRCSRSSARPARLAHSLLADVVDGDARLAWRGARVGLAGGGAARRRSSRTPSSSSSTSRRPGSRPRRDRICEIGAVRVKALEVAETFETLVRPGVALPPTIARLTGLQRRRAARRAATRARVRRFLAFAGDAPLAAHNARFDVGFLDRAVERLTGRRVAAPVIDTVWLARRLLHRRSERFSLRQLAHFFGTSCEPCHRALPDALATAEILVALLGLAQERGARTLAEVVELAAPRARQTARAPLARRRRTDDARRLPLPRPQRHRALRRQGARSARAAALVLRGRPAAAGRRGGARRSRARRVARARLGARGVARGAPPDPRATAARERAWRTTAVATSGVEASAGPWSPSRRRFGPISSKRRAQLAARALGDFDGRRPRGGAAGAAREAAATRARLALRGRRAAAGPHRCARGGRRRESRSSTGCAPRRCACSRLPASRPSGGRSSSPEGGSRARTIPRGAAGRLEIEAGLAASDAEPSLSPEDAADLLVVAGYLRRPPPELRVVGLRVAEIAAA